MDRLTLRWLRFMIRHQDLVGFVGAVLIVLATLAVSLVPNIIVTLITGSGLAGGLMTIAIGTCMMLMILRPVRHSL